MRLTTSRKICLGVLGVGVCALAYDHYNGVAAPEDMAAAASFLTRTPAAAKGTPAADGAAPAAADDLVARLAALRTTGPAAAVRDVFVPSSAWVAPQDTTNAEAEARRDAFCRTHVLKAVVAVGRNPKNGPPAAGKAMVNDKLLTVGQSIDGWRLVSVGPTRAVFAAGRASARLALSGTSETESDVAAAGEK